MACRTLLRAVNVMPVRVWRAALFWHVSLTNGCASSGVRRGHCTRAAARAAGVLYYSYSLSGGDMHL